MKLLIDTTLKKMIMILIKNNKTIYTFISEDQKKADLLPFAFKEMLYKNKIKTIDIKEFYVTKGPGSFMGARTALTFLRTIAQIQNQKLFIANTLEFIGKKNPSKTYLDAKSNKSFEFNPKTKLTKLVGYQKDTKIDYQDIFENTLDYLPVFFLTDPKDAKPLYIKDPTIGGK